MREIVSLVRESERCLCRAIGRVSPLRDRVAFNAITDAGDGGSRSSAGCCAAESRELHREDPKDREIAFRSKMHDESSCYWLVELFNPLVNVQSSMVLSIKSDLESITRIEQRSATLLGQSINGSMKRYFHFEFEVPSACYGAIWIFDEW